MSAPIFRATMYRPRSVDPDENVALTPRAGGSHSDPFQVATKAGIPGFQPYLDEVTGRDARVNSLTKKTDRGTLNLKLGDPVSGNTQLERWVTEFLGDASGSNQTLGNKVYVEASYDDGATWVSRFTGRVRSDALDGRDMFVIPLEDMLADLKDKAYVGQPHASLTHVAIPTILPIGPSADFGPIPATPPLTGTIQTFNGVRRLVVDAASFAVASNIVTQALSQAEAGWDAFFGTSVNPDVRIRINATSPSVVDKDLQPIKMRASFKDVAGVTRWGATAFDVQAVADTNDQFYIADDTGTIPDGTVVSFRVHPIRTAGESDVERAPILIGDVDPVQHIKDLLDGKYGLLDSVTGAPLNPMAYTASVTNAIGDPSLPPYRDVIKKSVDRLKAIQQICQLINFTYYPDADGNFVLVDQRPPSSAAGLTTIGNDDVWSDQDPQWKQGRDNAIRRFIVKVYHDRLIADQELGDSTPGAFPALSPSRIESLDSIVAVDDFGRIDIGDGGHTIDARGLRAFQDELDSSGLSTRANRIIDEAGRIADQYRQPYSWGPMNTALRGPRTANMLALVKGGWAMVAVDELPDPNTNKRGGTRLVRIDELSQEGQDIVVRLLDGGPNAIAVVPTIGALTAGPNTKHEMLVPLTVNAAGDGIEFQIAATDKATAVRPAPTSPLWRPGWGSPIVTSQTILRQYLPSDMRIWPRARSVPNRTNGGSFPSPWVFPPGNGYLDTTAIAGPTGLAVSVVSARAFTLTVTPGDLNYVLEILLSSPSGDTPVYTGIREPAGSTQHRGAGTIDGDTYGAQVRHADGFGGFSALSNKVTWTATGADPQAPDIRSAFAFEVIAP